MMMYGGAGADPYFSSVVLLLDASNLADTATTFTDYSPVGRTLTAVANAQADTTIKKFNSSSLQLDGTSDILTTPKTSDFDFGSGAFTIEGWLYPTTITQLRFIFANRSATGSAGFYVYMNTTGKIVFNAGEGTIFNNAASAGSLILNAWNHFSIIRSGSVLQFHINGNNSGGASAAGSIAASNNTLVRIGSAEGEVGTRDWLGYMDQLRVTKGIARYPTSGGITVPTVPFPHS